MRFLLLLAFAAALSAAVQSDIEFAKPGGFSLTLDAHIPDGPGPFPAAIIVHGGGFVRGDKQTYVPPLFAPLHEAGIAWFSINYRLAPSFTFPAPIEDLSAAMAWVKKNAKEYRVDPKRIVIIGESAGGTIVAYYGATAKGALKPKAIVDLYGVVDWPYNKQVREGGLSKEAISWLGGNDITQASAITHIHKGMPPYFFIHGTKDAQVPFEHSPRMCSAMRLKGAVCEVFVIEGAGHGMGGWEKEPAFQAWKPALIAWLKKNL
jgi:acetyl esterase